MLRVGLTSAAEVLALVGIVLASVGDAYAQPQPRDVGVYATPEGQGSSIEMPGFSPRNMYVVGFELDGEVKGFEMSLSLPPEFTVLALEFGCLHCAWFTTIDDIVIGTGGCFPGSPSYRLFSVNFGYFQSAESPPETPVCIGPRLDPSPALNGRPGYLQCDGDLVPFGLAQSGGPHYPDGCLIINPEHPDELPVATEERSFGTLKARFAKP